MVSLFGKEFYGVIYKITNKVNGKVYIGQTTQPRGFKDRYGAKGEGIERVYNYSKKNNGNKHLQSSISKYGFDSFIVEEVFDVAMCKEELDEKEVSYIKMYQSDNYKYGYNKHEGGDLNKIDSETGTYIGVEVYCINKHKYYTSYNEASRDNGVSSSYVIYCCAKEKVNPFNVSLMKPLFRLTPIKYLPKQRFCSVCGREIHKSQITSNRVKYCRSCSESVRNKGKSKKIMYPDKINNSKKKQQREDYIYSKKDEIIKLYNDGNTITKIANILREPNIVLSNDDVKRVLFTYKLISVEHKPVKRKRKRD